MWELETTGENGGLGFPQQQENVADSGDFPAEELVGSVWQRMRVSQHPGKWYGISVGLHLTTLILAVMLSTKASVPREPVLIDLTLDSSPLPEVPAEMPRQKVAAARTAAPPRVAPARSVPEPIREKALPEPTMPTAAPLAAPVQKALAPITSPSETVTRQPTSNNGGGVAAAGAQQASVGQSRGSSSAPGTGTDSHMSPEKAKSRYLREHFAYIRDLVMKQLAYPHMARKMGWSGKVSVSFIINEDGSAHDIKVVESSGYAMLDKSAVETIRGVAPFPRPPVRAEIVIPVQFKLM